MRGDVICHAVEVKQYTRILPNGRRVVVQGYQRNGNARQDEYRQSLPYKLRQEGNDFIRRSQYVQQPELRRAFYTRGVDALNNANRWDQDLGYNNPKVKDVVRWAATDAYETTKVVVGTIIEEAKFDAQVVGAHIENAVPKVKEAVSNGVQAVKSFFLRLFGRR